MADVARTRAAQGKAGAAPRGRRASTRSLLLVLQLRWSLRLGLANLLDNRELIEKNGDAASGKIVQWGVQAPRSWILRSSSTF